MAIVVSLLGLAVGGAVAIALVGIAVPAFVDGAAWLATPIERRLLERYRRRAASRLARVDPFVIAVTGSWGKTSTKNHIRDLLVGSAAVVASPASFNNTAGLSRTVNDHLADGTEVLVVEMGMYQPGEIRAMCSWVRPNVAVICSIGPMHLERVGSIERIVAAKAEILERADTAVLWVDDPHLDALSRQATVSKIWRVGSRGGDRLDVEVERGDDGVTVWVGGELIGSCPLQSGIHPGNLGCAAAAALAFGATHRQIRSRLSTLANPPHRSTMQRSDEGVVVIDDTFNSNPAGAAAAIASLARLAAGERVVVTPGMIELGHLQEDANVALGRTIVESGATLVAVGWTNRKALVEGAGGRAVVVADRAAARKWVRHHVREGGGVLWENDLPDHYP
jgi:UDP-N-acetylmuramoyl-tripeptide--D-alanyl-D-alanine ligase